MLAAMPDERGPDPAAGALPYADADGSSTTGPKRQLSILDGVAVIIGIVVGTGFYETLGLIALGVGSLAGLIGIWVLGGVVSLIGALCYAELATTYPREGGEYVFLRRAYGRPVGFLFAWTGFWIIRPGSIGAMAFVFARYAQRLLPLGDGPAAWGFGFYAVSSVVLLTAVNALGVRSGKWTQNLLTAAKLLGLLAVFTAALLLLPANPAPADGPAPVQNGAFYLAVILVLWAYGGWNDMSYVAAEVRDFRRNIWRALILGTAAIVVIYLVGNLAFVRVLGFEDMRQSAAVPADVLRLRFSRGGEAFISLLICVSCLGAINGMIFTGARIYYALGTDHPLFHWVGHWDPRADAPVRSLLLQGLVTVALMLAMGRDEQAFKRLVMFTGPGFWLFLLLTAISLPVLRFRDPGADRPVRVPGYPLIPLLFIAACAFMLYASASYEWGNRRSESWWTIAVLAAGVVAAWIDHCRSLKRY